MTEPNAAIVQQYAEHLSGKAASSVLSFALVGATGGAALGAIPGHLSHSLLANGVNYFAVLLGALAGGIAGRSLGEKRAVGLRLQAQLALRQLAVEALLFQRAPATAAVPPLSAPALAPVPVPTSAPALVPPLAAPAAPTPEPPAPVVAPPPAEPVFTPTVALQNFQPAGPTAPPVVAPASAPLAPAPPLPVAPPPPPAVRPVPAAPQLVEQGPAMPPLSY